VAPSPAVLLGLLLHLLLLPRSSANSSKGPLFIAGIQPGLHRILSTLHMLMLAVSPEDRWADAAIMGSAGQIVQCAAAHDPAPGRSTDPALLLELGSRWQSRQTGIAPLLAGFAPCRDTEMWQQLAGVPAVI